MRATCALAVLPVIACNALLGIDPPVRVVDEGGAPIVDAGTDDAGANLVTNPSFANGCDGWDPNGSRLTPISPGRTDSSACLVCGTGLYNIGQTVLQSTFASGAILHAEAYVRAVTPDAQGQPGVDVEIELLHDAETLRSNAPPSGTLTSDGSWTLITSSLTVDPDAADAGNGAYVLVISRDGDTYEKCFIVDDVLFKIDR